MKKISSLLISILALSVTSAFADDYYWGVASGAATDASSWFTDEAGNNVALSAPDLSTTMHDLFFNTTPMNGTAVALTGGTLTNGTIWANSLTYNSTATTSFPGSVVIGSGGITLGANSAAVQPESGGSSSTYIGANQTWINNSSNALNARILRTLSGGDGTTPVALTLNSVGTGAIRFTYIIQEHSSTPLSLVIDTTNTVSIQSNASTNVYSGGTTINRGTFSTNNRLGTGDVKLGNTTGSDDAQLTITKDDVSNNITVQAGSSGSKTLSAGVQLNGNLTLNDTLLFTSSNDATAINGVISGSGDLVKTGTNELTLGGANTFSGDLTIDEGNFTLDQSGSMSFYIGADGVNNQINGTSTDNIEFDGTFDFDLGGASLVDGNSWSLVSLTASETYGSNFNITGFSETGPDLWTNGSGLTFSETDGMLSFAVIPEPSSLLLMICGFAVVSVLRKRKK